MKSLFADSWFYIAVLDESDQHHRRVAQFAAASTDSLVTTRWVLAEVANCSFRRDNPRRCGGIFARP